MGSTRTNKGLKLRYTLSLFYVLVLFLPHLLYFRHGNNEKVFRLEFISNQDFTNSEFVKWKEVCSLNKIPMPTLEELDYKIRDIKNALAYQFKEEDVEKVIFIKI